MAAENERLALASPTSTGYNGDARPECANTPAGLSKCHVGGGDVPDTHSIAPSAGVNACARCERGIATGIEPFPWRRVPCPQCRPADHERELARLNRTVAAMERNAARNGGGR